MSAPQNLDVISAALQPIGFSLLRSQSGPMDSATADYSDGRSTLRVIKDRSQWFLDGARADLEAFGLWRAFDDTGEFRDALLAYISRRAA
jgi:hypothetical protein